MHQLLFEISIGENNIFAMTSYRFFGQLAAIYLLLTAWLVLRRHGIPPLQAVAALIVVINSFFIGSRLLYSLLYLPSSLGNPGSIFTTQLVNFTLHGGLAVALLAWWLTTKIMQMPLLKLTDQLAPHVGIAAALIRIGCFLNGCCFGKVTEVPWGVTFPRFSNAHLAQILANPISFLYPPMPVHPTQIYEMIVALAAALAAWIVLNKSPKVKSGVAAAIFGLTFSTGRLLVFFFRDFPAATITSNIIRGPVVYGLAIIIFSTWFYLASKN